MLNQIVLVGRLSKVESFDEKQTILTIAVSRNYKDDEGHYNTDFIPVVVTNSLREKATEFLQTGDLVGIKGYITSDKKVEQQEKIFVVADKLTFLSSKKQEEKEQEEEIEIL